MQSVFTAADSPTPSAAGPAVFINLPLPVIFSVLNWKALWQAAVGSWSWFYFSAASQICTRKHAFLATQPATGKVQKMAFVEKPLGPWCCRPWARRGRGGLQHPGRRRARNRRLHRKHSCPDPGGQKPPTKWSEKENKPKINKSHFWGQPSAVETKKSLWRPLLVLSCLLK